MLTPARIKSIAVVADLLPAQPGAEAAGSRREGVSRKRDRDAAHIAFNKKHKLGSFAKPRRLAPREVPRHKGSTQGERIQGSLPQALQQICPGRPQEQPLC